MFLCGCVGYNVQMCVWDNVYSSHERAYYVFGREV